MYVPIDRMTNIAGKFIYTSSLRHSSTPFADLPNIKSVVTNLEDGRTSRPLRWRKACSGTFGASFRWLKCREDARFCQFSPKRGRVVGEVRFPCEDVENITTPIWKSALFPSSSWVVATIPWTEEYKIINATEGRTRRPTHGLVLGY